MPRITRVYTRTGDAGTTGLGGGQRVSKASLRIDAYGTVDELNSAIGMAVAIGVDPFLDEALARIRNDLFHLGSDLCILEQDKETLEVPRIEPRHVSAIEQLVDRMQEDLTPLENFILPGGSAGAAALHLARTVCRRAERLVVALVAEEPVGGSVLPYLNRLSDALFVMARWENRARGIDDVTWDSRL